MRRTWLSPTLALPTAFLLAGVATVVSADTTPGLVPLTQATGVYMGIGQPGLYGGGLNQPSGAHAAYGDAETARIVPRDEGGDVDTNGIIGFISIGMSNTNQEWSRFERESDAASRHSGRVVMVTAAQGGADALSMANPASTYWTSVDARVANANVSPNQVQVIWLKQSLRGENEPWPSNATMLRDAVLEIIDILRGRFPHLAAVYLSSRSYGGYVDREPFAYETGIGVQQIVQSQISAIAAGTPDLGPFLAWGPYLWAHGSVPRDDGLFWLPEDFEGIDGDNVHTALPGERKVAAELETFFSTDARTSLWYPADSDLELITIDASDDAFVDPTAPTVSFGGEASLRIESGGDIYLRFPIDAIPPDFVRAKLSFFVEDDQRMPDSSLRVVNPGVWDQDSVTFATAPGTGATIRTVTGYSRGAAPSVDVTEQVRAALAASATDLELAIHHDELTRVGGISATEGADAPRLIVTIPTTVIVGTDAGGSPSDGAVARTDGGVPESDAGDSTGTDAGLTVDSGGCSCRAGRRSGRSPSLALLALAFAWLVRLRRR